MIGDYTNYSCSIRRPSLTNEQGERYLDDIGIELLPVFLDIEGKDEETDEGWIRLYDALGFVDKANPLDYEPLIGDKWIFSISSQYEITDVQPLRGMDSSHYGFRAELKALTQSGIMA